MEGQIAFCRRIYEISITDSIKEFINSILNNITINYEAMSYSHLSDPLLSYMEGDQDSHYRIYNKIKDYANRNCDENIVCAIRSAYSLDEDMDDQMYINNYDLMVGDVAGFTNIWFIPEECDDSELSIKQLIFRRFIYDRIQLEILKKFRQRQYQRLFGDELETIITDNDYTFSILNWQHA